MSCNLQRSFSSDAGSATPQRRRDPEVDNGAVPENTPSEQLTDIQKRTQQMNEYFSQYIEEYYEVEEKESADVAQQQPIVQEAPKVVKRPLAEITPDEVVELVRKNRARDVVCLEIPADVGPHPYMVICTPHNNRHAEALAITVRQHVIRNYIYPTKTLPTHVKATNGWFMFDMRTVIVHVMTEKARQKYDLESLWGIGEDVLAEAKDKPAALAIDDDFLPPPREAAR